MGFFSFLFGKPKRRISADTVSKIEADWTNIEILLKGKSPSQLKQALINADKCLDLALRDLVDGNSLGERLKVGGTDLFDRKALNKVWEAHKIRNNLIHEPGYEPPHYVLTDAVEKLRKGLDLVGVRL